MSEYDIHKEVIVDEDVYTLLQDFWDKNKIHKPTALQYLYIAGSSVNGGRQIARRESHTLENGDIDITYVSTATNAKEQADIQKYIDNLTLFYNQKKREGKIQFSEIHISSSKLLDNPIPNNPLSNERDALEIMSGNNLDKITEIVTQLCLPTVPESVGVMNKKQIAAALETLKNENQQKYDLLVDKISTKWAQMMRWKNKYKGENRSSEIYANDDYSELLAHHLINLLARG